jgi:hypothetical protein
LRYSINHITLSYEPDGEKTFGANLSLIDKANDLTKGSTWAQSGFTIEKLFGNNLQEKFKTATRALLIQLWQGAGLEVGNSLDLDQYHVVANNQEKHLAAIEKTKQIQVGDFPVSIKLLEERISAICNRKLVVRNPFDDQSIFHFRVIRPNQGDNNPLHRDVWLEDYDDCINLYIPVSGSNERSSLILFEGSHHWPESMVERTTQGAKINGVQFNVPAVTFLRGHHEPVRPNPDEDEVLIFSPYLIHGGSVNLNKNRTRISLEVRLWEE